MRFECRLMRGRSLKVVAYPRHLQLFITSSNSPIMLNHTGILDLFSMLGEARHILINEFSQPTPLYEVDNPYVIIPDVLEWTWTDRERQIDGKTDIRLSGRPFSFKVRLFGHLFQIYSKFVAGKAFLRLEEREMIGRKMKDNIWEVMHPKESAAAELRDLKMMLGYYGPSPMMGQPAAA